MGDTRPGPQPTDQGPWSERFPRLWDLLAGYFYQLSHEYYPTTADAVTQYANDNKTATLRDAAGQLDAVLALGLDEQELAQVLGDLGSDYIPSLGGDSNLAFLHEIADVLRAELKRREQER